MLSMEMSGGNRELFNELSVSIKRKFFEYRNVCRPSLATVVFCALQVTLLVGNASKQYKYYCEAMRGHYTEKCFVL